MWQATESRPAWLGEPTVPFVRPSVSAYRCPERCGGGEQRFSDGRRIRSPWTRHRRRTRRAFQRRVPLRTRTAVSLRGTRQACIIPFPGGRGRKRLFSSEACPIPSPRRVPLRPMYPRHGLQCPSGGRRTAVERGRPRRTKMDSSQGYGRILGRLCARMRSVHPCAGVGRGFVAFPPILGLRHPPESRNLWSSSPIIILSSTSNA